MTIDIVLLIAVELVLEIIDFIIDRIPDPVYKKFHKKRKKNDTIRNSLDWLMLINFHVRYACTKRI